MMTMWLSRTSAWLLGFCLLSVHAGVAWATDRGGTFPPGQIEFFETKVRPLLSQRCFSCHSAKAKKLKAGLRLDERSTAIKGGESGAAVVPHKPDESLLVEAIRWESFEMPPQGKLPPREVSVLVKWVEMGAPWTATSPTKPDTGRSAAAGWKQLAQEHWAFRPIDDPPLPQVAGKEWPQNGMDHFILAKLEDAGLSPAPPAPPRVLARRIYLDLIGLPPTLEQVDGFSSAWRNNPRGAVSQLVDQLLASPHYGERWARHWLDVARYCDGYGGFSDNSVFDQAWRYRDWVVHALNEDLPLDQFIQRQIAGDLSGDRQAATATGFFALGPTYRSDGGDPDSVAQARAETLSDRVDLLGRGLLALTLACARCHDHKFDPIPQSDYYAIAGIFNNTSVADSPLVSDQVVATYDQHQQKIRELDKRIKDLRKRRKQEKREPNDAEQAQLDQWSSELGKLRETAPAKYAFAHALRDTGSADMHVAIRGNLRKEGELVHRHSLTILAGSEATVFREGSGRQQLAAAITDPKNPLTARVFVNRVWQHHFGEGLVRTPDNFGVTGEPPTHPMLLDWLTSRFIESGLSIKALHRMILLSATYQSSSDFAAEAYQQDSDNRLLWRMNRRRLDVEAWRDAMLSVTGEIDLTLGGPPTDRVEDPRRTLYFKVSRNGDVFATDRFLRLFDFPLMRATIDQRSASIVPPQFLFLLNSTFMVRRAEMLAKRLGDEATSVDARIRHAYRLLFQRSPTADELRLGSRFVHDVQSRRQGAAGAWQEYAQVLLCSNEFMYVD